MAHDHGSDRLLDRTIVPGYSKLGFAWRRRHWSPKDPKSDALAGKTALVTGAGGGLGEAVTLGLARLGARVHLLVRSPERAKGAVHRIRTRLASENKVAILELEQCDISDPSQISAFAEDFCARDNHASTVDILVHNAGVMPPERINAADGHELSVSTHVLGPIKLTEELLPALRRSTDGARVVFVSSGGI